MGVLSEKRVQKAPQPRPKVQAHAAQNKGKSTKRGKVNEGENMDR